MVTYVLFLAEIAEIAAPIELNDVSIPSIEFDNVDGVHIPPALSFRAQNRASKYIKRKIKMKVESSNDQIVEVPTTCFGSVEFRGSSRKARSKVGL